MKEKTYFISEYGKNIEIVLNFMVFTLFSIYSISSLLPVIMYIRASKAYTI